MRKVIATAVLTVVLAAAGYAQQNRDPAYFYPVLKDLIWGFINQAGEVVIPPRLIFTSAEPFSDGRAAVSVKHGDTSLVGYINRFGELAIPARFAEGLSFSEGLAAVQVGGRLTFYGKHGALEGGKWGFIDTTGKLVIPTQFESCREFSEGVAMVRDSIKGYFIDRFGKPVFEVAYSAIGRFSEGLGRVRDSANRIGYVDHKGNVVVPVQFGNAEDFSGGRAWVRQNSWSGAPWGAINRTGKLAIDTVFAEVRPFSEGLAAVKKGKVWGFIDTTGKFVIEPRFADALGFSEDLAPVAPVYLWGYCDRTGAMVIQPLSDLPGAFRHGLAKVWIDEEKLGYIDKTGKFVWGPTK